MIRNVVLMKLRPDHDPAKLAEIQRRLRSLDCPGTLAYSVGTDAGLKEGSWGLAIVADFVDDDAYLAYDADEEHNRIRADIAPLVESVARAQFRL